MSPRDSLAFLRNRYSLSKPMLSTELSLLMRRLANYLQLSQAMFPATPEPPDSVDPANPSVDSPLPGLGNRISSASTAAVASLISLFAASTSFSRPLFFAADSEETPSADFAEGNVPVPDYVSDARPFFSPRHPVILCHGLFGFDKMGPDSLPSLQVHYWRGIAPELDKIGCTVFVAKVPSAGTVEERAQALRDFIEQKQLPFVNLIAHSMGGLDCRYMIWRYAAAMRTRILSLTTVSTPHRGSPFMDWCAKTFGVSRHWARELHTPETIGRRIPPIRAILGRAVDMPAYSCLTTEYCTSQFNHIVRDDSRTAYFSYGAHATIPFWAPLHFPWKIVHAFEGENDGLVSVSSANWGHYLGTLPTDHWGLSNRWLSSKAHPGFDAILFYKGAVTRLYHLGF